MKNQPPAPEGKTANRETSLPALIVCASVRAAGPRQRAPEAYSDVGSVFLSGLTLRGALSHREKWTACLLGDVSHWCPVPALH